MPPIPTRRKSGFLLLNFARTEQERLSKAGMARRVLLCVFATVVCLAVVFRDSVPLLSRACSTRLGFGADQDEGYVGVDDELCPQPPSLVPSTQANKDVWEALVPLGNGTFASHTFFDRAINWLGGAVRIPYVCRCSYLLSPWCI